MKKSILIFTMLLSSFAFQAASAQVRLGLNFNIGVQPLWGPVGYDRADYYYMPDIDVYYNVSNHQYIYMQGGRWAFSTTLPARYHDYDLYSGHKVVINESRPWLHAQSYRMKYAEYKGRHDQEVIRNSHEQKYFENKDHPQHNEWKGRDGKGNNGKGNDKGHGNDHHGK